MKPEEVEAIAQATVKFLGYKKPLIIVWIKGINHSYAIAKKGSKEGRIFFNAYLALQDDFYQTWVAVHEACHVVISNSYGMEHAHDKVFKDAERSVLKGFGLDVDYASKYPKKLTFFGKTVFQR